MKILHTSDWHLGSRLHGYDRTDELFEQVKQVCDIAKQNQVDVLLVAGDVFEKRGTALPELTKKLANVLSPYIHDGLHIILVPGNHDDREHFNMMDALLTLDQGRSEKVHVVKTRKIFTIQNVQFAAIPYPIHEVLDPYMGEVKGATERNVLLSSAYANLMRSVVDETKPDLPTVIIGHINVAGVTTPSNYETTYDNDIRLGRGDLPIASNIKYIALGHIHQYQPIDHPIPCFYSGSIERMDWGEKEDTKQVILVDIPEQGEAKVIPISLETTPFYSVEITTSQLDDLPSLHPDLNRAFVTVQIKNEDGIDPASLYRTIRELCPKQIDFKIIGNDEKEPRPTPVAHPRSYIETVHGYIADRYKDDPDLPELKEMTNQLIVEVENVASAD
jgi:DNA repair protein SbcD/Mre11